MPSTDSNLAQRVRSLKPSPTLAIDAKAKALKAQGVDIVNLSAGEPDFDTPAHVKEAAIKAIRDGFTKYTAVNGILELRQAIAERFKNDYGLTYDLDQILVSAGGKQALYNVTQAILDSGDEVIIPVPYWVSYPPIVELAGGVPRLLPSDPSTGFALDHQALRSIVGPRTKALILNSPSNPTGATYSREDLQAVAGLAKERGFLVISDDIYDAIRFDGRGPENIASVAPEISDQVIIVNGVSKTYAMTGWRVGYLAGPTPIVRAATKIQSQSTSNANSIAQKASLAALTGSQDCVEEMVEAFRERREYVTRRLRAMPEVSCVAPQGAFYVFPNLSAYYGAQAGRREVNDSLGLTDYLLEEARIATVPGIAFGDDKFLRLSFVTDMATLGEGMDRLEKALSRLERKRPAQE